MSAWTYVWGTVSVCPPGDGQRAKDFVIGEVVDHLPRVTGSEGDMHVEIVRRPGSNGSSNHDEFGMPSDLGRNGLGYGKGCWFDVQGTYDLLLVGHLRDRHKDETLREFCRWMSRLAKRVCVEDMLVRLSDCYGWSHLFDGAGAWEWAPDNWTWVRDEVDRTKRDWSYGYAHDRRHYANWRYGLMGEPKNWTENLINLLPGGGQVAKELDEIMGNLEWYEYGQSVPEVEETIAEVEDARAKMEKLLCDLREWKYDLRVNPLDDR